MSVHRVIQVSTAGLVLGLLSVAASFAHADPPGSTLRLFGELNGSCVDWEADESKRLVTHRDRDAQGVIEFITPGGAYNDDDAIVRDSDGNVLLDLRSTVWVRTPVLHITDGGTEDVPSVYWMLEDLDGDGELDAPRPGMTAPTGPDGDVATFITIRLTQAPGSDLDNPNRYYLNPTGSVELCIAVGAFAT